ncbi:MAG TPA: endo alpha-1,4 polygalactosaminidase [Pirellulales bacterium]|nr:endo alpha-1,4 polygalactosaminidase [Pirellulales bacterium]
MDEIKRVARVIAIVAVLCAAGIGALRFGGRGQVRAVEAAWLRIEGAAKKALAAAGIGVGKLDATDKRALASTMNPVTTRFAVYYANKLPPQAFALYDIIVFDRDRHPRLLPLERPGRILLAYVSFGEAEKSRSDYADLENQGLILNAPANWRGNSIIDVRRPEWGDYVLNQLIPAIIAQGFDGVMLDTTDSLIEAEKASPARCAGLSRATIGLIKEIRGRYPHLIIMLNRGFEILPQVEGDIDFEVAESIYTHWTGVGAPALVPDAVYRHYVTQLKKAEAEAPTLKVATIDYWPADDKKTIRGIYAAKRAQGFIPYVTTPDLQSLAPQPQ